MRRHNSQVQRYERANRLFKPSTKEATELITSIRSCAAVCESFVDDTVTFIRDDCSTDMSEADTNEASFRELSIVCTT